MTFYKDFTSVADLLGRTCLLPLNTAVSGVLAQCLHFSFCYLCSFVYAGFNKHSHRACHEPGTFFHPSISYPGVEVFSHKVAMFSPESCLVAPDQLFFLSFVKGRDLHSSGSSLSWSCLCVLEPQPQSQVGSRVSSTSCKAGHPLVWSPVCLCLLSPFSICLLSSSPPLSSTSYLGPEKA